MKPGKISDLENVLFRNPQSTAFAILDGASIPDLLDQLYKKRLQFDSLYKGHLTPDMAEVVPYIVQLEKDCPFTRWALESLVSKSCGILGSSMNSLRILKKYFRQMLDAEMPDGKIVSFRFYDPRIFNILLTSASEAELTGYFSLVDEYLVANEDSEMLAHRIMSNQLMSEQI